MTPNNSVEAIMERVSLLSALSPQLQALVEASLGESLPDASRNEEVRPSAAAQVVGSASGEAEVSESRSDEEREMAESSTASASGSASSAQASPAVSHPPVVKLNPSELFGAFHTFVKRL
jgi:hypothetical protein